MGLRGDLSNLARLRSNLRSAPITLAHAVASKAAPVLTGFTQEAQSSQRSVYGEAYPAGVTLERSGATKQTLRFTASGTVVSCFLGTSYAKYLIRFGLIPNAKAEMPVAWSRALGALVPDTRVPL